MIVPNNTGPDWVNLSDVKYTQKTVSIKSGDGTPVLDIAYQMKNNGWDLSKGAPDLIKLDDGFMTLDHRRLVAADWAGLDEIPANIHGFNEVLPSSFVQSERFTSFRSPVDFSDISTQTTFYKGFFVKHCGALWKHIQFSAVKEYACSESLKGSKTTSI